MEDNMNLTSGKMGWRFMAVFLTFGLMISTDVLLAGPMLKAEQSSTAIVLSTAQPLSNFSLLDTSNKPFTQASLKDHWTLLFFGYAQCPKICPQVLTTIAETWRSVSQPNAQFVFVTLDPKADTPEALKQFLVHFNPTFIGITGEDAEIKKLAQACRIHSWAEPNLNATGQKIIDHSTTLILLNPQGKIHALFSPPHQAEELAKELKVLMKS
jgi:protein SCO1/2